MPWPVIGWFLVVGILLMTMATLEPLLRQRWLSCSMIYLVIGFAIGPTFLTLIQIDLVKDAMLLEHLTELAVIVSLFGAGLKMRMPIRDHGWNAPLILASVTMTVAVLLTTGIGVFALGMPIGAALLLGAVLAPTDPVLAGEVQIDHPDEKDRLRLTLTGEAGLNDGTAFPFVLLAVGLIAAELHPLGDFWWRWWVIDVVYRVLGGAIVGWLVGNALGHGVLAIRRRVRAASPGADEMLTMGMIAICYGVGLLTATYAFLTVFFAAVAIRKIEMAGNEEQTASEAIDEANQAEADGVASVPEHAAALLTRDGLMVTDALERLAEILLVVIVGALLSSRFPEAWSVWAFALVMVFLLRPLSVILTLWGSGLSTIQWRMVAWFGVRGIGTLYYLTHAFGLGVSEQLPESARLLTDLALATIATSILVHGFSVTPMMQWYERLPCRQG